MVLRAAAFAATLAVVLPFAAPADAARQPVAANVSTRGLDLSTPQGVERLKLRLANAIDAACDSREDAQSIKSGVPRDTQCRDEMRADAQAKLAAIVPARGDVQVGDTTGGSH